MKAYPISDESGWAEAAAVEIAKAFAITALYKSVDSFSILIVPRDLYDPGSERRLQATIDSTPEMLSRSIEAAMVSLFPGIDQRKSSGVSDRGLLFFWGDGGAGALAEIEWRVSRLSIHLGAGGLPESLTDAMDVIADQMDCPIGSLSLLKSSQWPKMLIQSPDALPYWEYRLPLIAYLREAMRRYADNIAYLYDESRLSYAELDGGSDKLAFILAQRGVTKGDLVIIALDNSLELPVAYMACMKLGAVFTPADCQWPEVRLKELAESIRPKAVIAAPAEISWAGSALITGCLSDWQSASGTWQGETLAGPDDLLYGFFTSGSTGMPKCALNTQKGAVNRFMYMDKVFRIRQDDDVILQNSNTSFDSSLWQLLWPLLSGCKIVIPRRKNYIDIDYTLQLIAKHRVTMTDFVPSVFNLMLCKLEANFRLTEMLASMKAVLVGGEAFSAKFISRFYRLCPRVSLFNTYGHTEATIGMVFYPIPRDFGGVEVPLGLPIDNTYVILLDRQQRPVPPGMTAEIFVGGACIGAGYYNEPDKNARTFPPNPFAFVPGNRLFRTGDFGMVGADGLLYYKGRNDDQIKIGGARFELSEIEYQCLRFPGVRAAKVLYEADNQKLVAFIASGDTSEVFKTGLFQSLKDWLPAYAVPGRVFVLDSFPLTGNGKVDVVALKRSIAGKGKREPQSSAREIRKLFRESLELEELDDEANFFSQGGTSLKALKLILDIETLLHVSIDLDKVYHDLTIRRLIKVSQDRERTNEAAASTDDVEQMLTDYVSLSNSVSRAIMPNGGGRKRDVLLTGAGGFFGVQLLSDLLERSNAIVHCLMRDGDEEQAYERLARKLTQYDLPAAKFTRDRVRIIQGDLTRENWGLTAATVEELRQSVGAVLHNAAEVDLARKYTDLRSVNVAPIKFLLEFCTSGSCVPLHFISTVSIFSDQLFTHYDIVPDKILYDFDCIPAGGYNQSKWVGEKVLVSARNKGLPLSIYRLGEIAPNNGTGIANERSLLAMLNQAILYLKAYPDSDMPLDYFPADLAGKLIVQSVLEDGGNRDINMVNTAGISINQVAGLIIEQGVQLERLPYGAFKKRLDSAASSGKDIPSFLYALKFLLPAEAASHGSEDAMDTVFFKYLNRISDLNLSKRLGGDRLRLNGLRAYIERLVKPGRLAGAAMETITNI
ncbi:MAG TPA: amino acid adenylation domain-containing protein [Puia sp.]|jgi:amino acid adenylation domain-containing protein/thioester reductase-like protein|nr:amino acid adenylation domain-containing protein [Puia sp.]